MNRIEKKFLENIRRQRLAESGDAVLLAVSGGPDSMALLHLFAAASPVLRCRLGVAHCNFTLRGKESDGDEAFVRDVCRALGIECHVRRFDTASVSLAWKKSVEESARSLRYDFFDELCREAGFTRIATGHHSGDNAETVLFNLFRGTGVSGLRGIRARHGAIIRPLLPFTRWEIVAYLEEKQIAWRDDHTNEGIEYDRNFIRNRVIPVIEERFGSKFSPSMQRLSAQAGELEAFIDLHISRLLEAQPGLDLAGGKLHVGAMRQLSIFERKEILKRALKLQGLPVDSQALARIAGLLDNQSGRSVPVGAGVEAVRQDGFLRFRQTGDPSDHR
ncbi:tRNA lysidine(34) synthetase TilS [Chlorobaculum thiosulfatiphilum]|uniref:tRNA(Ile)-lysidine synthase n=1 Tax=Chlorobaculum thiosulfatiphilum TaxID=115852 RepID=A0A5C4S8U4_CHLTI|nr:tRNA lysidine(34) synthetase TilS [Chlorobaculum thiosulfatiphilum]TNJ39692.1 tRNA lysidine(34) synthetase TilS [Chlorobaculum thiosulfatiphilum]